MLLRDLANEALFSWNPDEAVAFCPRCKSTDVKDSLYRVGDIVSLLAGFKPIRCKCCHHRFRIWRFFREEIRPQERETALVLAARPKPMEAALAAVRARQNFTRLLAAPPSSLEEPAANEGQMWGSLANLVAATNHFTPDHQAPVTPKRSTEADFSASLASAARATAHSYRPPSSVAANAHAGFKPPIGPANRRKGDRPRMHMAQRPSTPTPAPGLSTNDALTLAHP